MKKLFFILLLVSHAAIAADIPGPYFHAGDGNITIQGKAGGIVRATFRRGPLYDDTALQKINQAFGAPWNTPTERVSLRLIELLDHVQDHFRGATIILMSGYRSPDSNSRLRALGKLAAQSSMHMEGEAIDCHLQGVPSEQVFEYVKGLNCCGIGYYHGREVHIDVGPPRFWDETTSGTEDKAPQENSKIIVVADRDRYRAGEKGSMKFMRITNYPVVVPTEFVLEWQPSSAVNQPHSGGEGGRAPSSDGAPGRMTGRAPVIDGVWKKTKLKPQFVGKPRVDGCVVIKDRREARSVQFTAPYAGPAAVDGIAVVRVKVKFCEKVSDKMPDEITSNTFEIFGY